MAEYSLIVQDLCWTTMRVAVEADSLQEAVEKVARQDDGVTWDLSETLFETSEKTEVFTADGDHRLLWSSAGSSETNSKCPNIPH